VLRTLQFLLGLLQSVLACPQATFGQNDLYPDLWSKAAALATTGIFLELNGHTLTAGNEAVLEFTRQVVVGGMEIAEMAAWLEAHSQPFEED